MLLYDLNESQKIAFHNLAMKLIYSDDILDMNEAQLMAKLDREMGLSDKNIPKIDDLEELFVPFDTKKSKAIVILELLILGNSDNEFNNEENKFIQKVSDSLGISHFELSDMKWWVKKRVDLDKEVMKFLD